MAYTLPVRRSASEILRLRARLPVAAQQPAPVEEDDPSLAGKVGQKSLSGLAAAGNFLDLPGSSIRDVLAGKNPFDQYFSPFSGENRTTGRKLLQEYGVLGSNRVGRLDAGDIAGFAAEVAFDPLTYLSGGASALGKGGQVVKAAGGLSKLSRVGRMTTKVADAASTLKPGALDNAARAFGFSDEAAFLARHGNDPVGGLVGVGLPFSKPSLVLGKQGGAAEKFAGALDTAGQFVRESKPGRLTASLFDKTVMGTTSKIGQAIARQASKRFDDADYAARSAMAPIVRELHEAGVLQNQDSLRAVVRAVEDVAPLPPELAHIQPHVDTMRTMLDDILPAEQTAHLKSDDLNDINLYLTRQAFRFADSPRDIPEFISRRLFKTTHTSMKHRKDFLRGLAGGTDIINELSLNPKWSGIAKRTGQALDKDAIATNAREIEDFLQQQTGQVWTLDEGQPEQLAKWLANLDPRYADEGVPIFGTNPVENVMHRVAHGKRAIEASEVIRDSLKQYAGRMDDLGAGAVPLKDVIAKTNLADSAADEVAQALGMGVDDVAVPADIAADILQVSKPFSSPENVHELLQTYDKVLSLYKSSLTTLFPAFHSRNFASGMIQNVLTGAFTIRSFGQALDILHGKDAKKLSDIPAFRGMSDSEATAALQDAAFATGIVDPVQGLASAGDAYGTRLPSMMPGLEPTGVFRAFKSQRPVGTTRMQAAMPWNAAGVGTSQDVFYPFRVGREMGRTIENLNRLQPFIALLKKGLSPQEAAARVKAAHVDYTALSEFERSVMKRALPFYAFSRGQAAFLADELTQHPGGGIAQSIRAVNSMRDDDESMPEHVSQTAAIPLGESPDGTRSFITGLGLMHEDPLSLFSVRGGRPDVSDTLSELISRSTPLAKAPIELAAGESFFQRGPLGGRELTDMDPTLGRTLTNIGLREELPGGRARPLVSTNFENIIANTPLSRVTTTARTLTDPRKWSGGPFPGSKALLNVGTGLRVSDVSPGAMDAVARDELFAAMRGAGASAFENVRYTNEQIAYAEKNDPELAKRMKAQNAAADKLAADAKARKAAKAQKK